MNQSATQSRKKEREREANLKGRRHAAQEFGPDFELSVDLDTNHCLPLWRRRRRRRRLFRGCAEPSQSCFARRCAQQRQTQSPCSYHPCLPSFVCLALLLLLLSSSLNTKR